MPRGDSPVPVGQLIDAVVRAFEKVEDDKRSLDASRVALAQAIREAQASGISLALIGRALGISRQRVEQLSRRAR